MYRIRQSSGFFAFLQLRHAIRFLVLKRKNTGQIIAWFANEFFYSHCQRFGPR